MMADADMRLNEKELEKRSMDLFKEGKQVDRSENKRVLSELQMLAVTSKIGNDRIGAYNSNLKRLSQEGMGR